MCITLYKNNRLLHLLKCYCLMTIICRKFNCCVIANFLMVVIQISLFPPTDWLILRLNLSLYRGCIVSAGTRNELDTWQIFHRQGHICHLICKCSTVGVFYVMDLINVFSSVVLAQHQSFTLQALVSTPLTLNHSKDIHVGSFLCKAGLFYPRKSLFPLLGYFFSPLLLPHLICSLTGRCRSKVVGPSVCLFSLHCCSHRKDNWQRAGVCMY